MAKMGSARMRSRQVLPYSADWQVRSPVSPLPPLPDLTNLDMTCLIDEKFTSFQGGLGGGGVGGPLLRSIFTGYVLLASQNPYGIIYSQLFVQ